MSAIRFNLALIGSTSHDDRLSKKNYIIGELLYSLEEYNDIGELLYSIEEYNDIDELL